jgi:hypothetical protein
MSSCVTAGVSLVCVVSPGGDPLEEALSRFHMVRWKVPLGHAPLLATPADPTPALTCACTHKVYSRMLMLLLP